MSIETLANVLLYMGQSASSPIVPLVSLLQPIADQLLCDFVGFQIAQGTFTEWYPDRHLSRLRDELVDSAPYEMIGGRAVQYGLMGLNSQVIQLKQLPVRSITSLRENPSAWNVVNPPSFPPPDLVEGIDYIVDYAAPDSTGTKLSWTGDVYRLTGVWYVSPWAGRTVQVTYTAGFTATELTTGPWPAFYPRARLASMMTTAKLVREALAQAGDSVGTTVTGTSGGAHTTESLAGHSISYHAEAALNNLGMELAMPRAAMRLLEPYVRMGWYS
jgi:hypothetical protein